MVNDSVRYAIDRCPVWFDQTAKVTILIGTASGMAFMHDRNIIHMCLRPANILLDESFEPKICGFGSAEAIPTPEGLSGSFLCGFPPYQAPESIRGEPLGVKADVYAFGMMIYAIMTGEPPFCLKRGGLRVAEKIIVGVRPNFPSQTPRAVVELAETCWDASPEYRPTSREVLRTLCSPEFLQSIPDLDFTILRDFASRTVPPELRGFLGVIASPL
jgi:serine/threonine protein kinase